MLGHAEGASHPASGLAQAGGDGHFLNAGAKIVDHAGDAAHGGHAGGKAVGMHHVIGGFRLAIEQGLAPVAHVLPGAQQGEGAGLLLAFAREIQFSRARALRGHDEGAHPRGHLAFHHGQHVARIFAGVDHAPGPDAVARRQRLGPRMINAETWTHHG